MFCTKCGKQLHTNDRFCAHCGNKVRSDEVKSDTGNNYASVVFNPPFKIEAERQTEQIAKELRQYSVDLKTEPIHFEWNLEGFPSPEAKHEDDNGLNWEEVVEGKKPRREIDIEKIVPEADPQEEIQQPAPDLEMQFSESEFDFVDDFKFDFEVIKEEQQQVHNEEAKAKAGNLSIEDLERELFGATTDSDEDPDAAATIQYTRGEVEKAEVEKHEEPEDLYEPQQDAFQKLLDEERRRVEELVAERKAQWDALAPGEDLELKRPRGPLPFEDVFSELELLKGNFLRQVDIAMPPLPFTMMAEEDGIITRPSRVVTQETHVQKTVAKPAVSPVAAPEPVIKPEPVAPPEPTVRPEPAVAPESAVSPEPVVAPETVTEPTPVTAPQPQEETMAEPKVEATPSIVQEPKTAPAAEGAQAKQQQSQEVKPEKTKLRYSDIFPTDMFDTGSNEKEAAPARATAEAAPDEEEEEKSGVGNLIIKILLIIVSIVVAFEIIIFGVKVVAPGSSLSLALDGLLLDVMEIFSGDEEDESSKEEEKGLSYMDAYVQTYDDGAESIGSIVYNPNIKYEILSSYVFEDVSQGVIFNTSSADSDTKEKTGTIVKAVIEYYDSWQERNEDDSLVGINTLEIGEIRNTDSGYYVLNKVIYAAEEGGAFQSYETVYLSESEQKMTVKEVKEETL